MVDIAFKYDIDGQAVLLEELEGDYELAMLFEHTREQVRRQVQTRLEGLRCMEHDQPPRVLVTIAFSQDTDQSELSYHIDTCCKPFLLQTVQALNH